MTWIETAPLFRSQTELLQHIRHILQCEPADGLCRFEGIIAWQLLNPLLKCLHQRFFANVKARLTTYLLLILQKSSQ